MYKLFENAKGSVAREARVRDLCDFEGNKHEHEGTRMRHESANAFLNNLIDRAASIRLQKLLQLIDSFLQPTPDIGVADMQPVRRVHDHDFFSVDIRLVAHSVLR